MSSNIEKAIEAEKNNLDTEKVLNHEVAEKVFETTKEQILPSIREKAEEVSLYIEKVLKEKDEDGLTATKILPLIAKRSLNDIVITTKTFTSQELAIAFNIYVDMINKINNYAKFPPNKGTFCQMLGISRATYDNYMQDPEKCEIMRIIDDYITTTILTSSQIGELREISSMFTLKSNHGFVEASAPVVIEHKKTNSVEDIKARLQSIKGNIIDAEYEVKEKED